jgi:hypothetical protein
MHRAFMVLPGDGRPGRRIWRLQPKCAVGPVAVVMLDVDPQDLVKVVAPEDQQPAPPPAPGSGGDSPISKTSSRSIEILRGW